MLAGRRPGDIDHSAPHVAGVCPRETTGPPMFLGNPLVPMPCSLTPAGPSCLALTTGRPGPRPKQNEGYPRLQFRGSITRPQHSLFTLRRADCSTTTQNSLPADWLGPPAGLDTRRVPTKGFRDSYITSSSFPKLAWRTSGGPGRFPALGSHRPVRAQLRHTVPQVMDLPRAEYTE